MEKQISIIIPTYNMEAYIGKCLDSLLIPEFDQVEVLVVNDGSKDRSSEIAHSYADRYPESIRVIDKPNGNYGSCINAALPQCTGRYVKVLDADDTFDTAAFSKFVRTLATCNEDMIITGYYEVDTNGETTKIIDLDYFDILPGHTYNNIDEAHSSFLRISVGMHRICYNSQIFSRFTYKQTEGISYTDVQWSIVPSAFCMSFKFIDLNLYRYLLGREGQTMGITQRIKHFNQLFKINEDLLSFFYNLPTNKSSKYLFTQIVNFNIGIVRMVLSDTANLMAVFKEYDLKNKAEHPELYNALNETRYDKKSSFLFIKNLRKNKYPTDYRIPKTILLRLAITNKFSNLFK